jgi:transposase InsO family protein
MDERKEFILAALGREASVSELCRRWGISRKTGYKWLERYEEIGSAGLSDRSHAPLRCPHRLDEALIEGVLALRSDHPSWGPKKLRAWLVQHRPSLIWPAASTIGEMLRSRGLSVPRRRRDRVPPGAPFGAVTGANDVWTVDFKGWFRTADGARCDPLTLQDAHSRYLLRCQAVKRTGGECVWPIFDAAFREYGLPLRLRSDNGPPFATTAMGGLSKLAIQLIKAGVVPERIEPGKPQQNGRHERFHLTLKRETASPPAASVRAQQRRFNGFRDIYNQERPHEALGQTPPAQHFGPSPRRYSGRLKEPDYPDGTEVRRVRYNGEIKWRGEYLYVGQVLAGEPVGCRQIDDERWQLSYGPLDLGIIDAYGRLHILRRRPHNRPTS